MPSATIDPSSNGTSTPTSELPATVSASVPSTLEPPARAQTQPATPESLAPAFAAALFEAKSFALATLSDIMRDHQAPPKERRLAATAILHFSASVQKPLPEGGVGGGRKRARADDSDPDSPDRTPGSRDSRSPSNRPPPTPPGFTPNADVLAKSRLAYDHGYWTAFCNGKHSHNNLHGPAAPAPGRESVTLDPCHRLSGPADCLCGPACTHTNEPALQCAAGP